MNHIHTILIILCCVITSTVSSSSNTDYLASANDLLNSKKIEQWRNDIDFMQQQLEQHHIHLHHTIKADAFNKEIMKIKQQLPLLTETNLIIELMRLVKQVGDGHTQFAYWGGKHHRYPLVFRIFDNELRLIGIAEKHQHLLGATLVAIDDIPIKKARELIIPILQGVENIHSEKQRLSETITVAEVLHGLKITKTLQQANFTLKLPTGEEHQLSLKSLSVQQFQQQTMASLTPSGPEHFIQHKLSTEGIDLHFSKNGQIAYLDFRRYPTFSKMESFAKDLIDLLRKQETREVIIDLRNNGGGDFFVGLHLAWALILVDNLNWCDGMYVLIDRKTFSAAMSNAAQYRQLLNARLVGEPTGANPVGYQDAGTFSLPHSNWTVMYSKRLYRFQDSVSAGVEPDIKIELDWNAYRAGKDNQLDWVLNDIRARYHINSH